MYCDFRVFMHFLEELTIHHTIQKSKVIHSKFQQHQHF